MLHVARPSLRSSSTSARAEKLITASRNARICEPLYALGKKKVAHEILLCCAAMSNLQGAHDGAGDWRFPQENARARVNARISMPRIRSAKHTFHAPGAFSNRPTRISVRNAVEQIVSEQF